MATTTDLKKQVRELRRELRDYKEANIILRDQLISRSAEVGQLKKDLDQIKEVNNMITRAYEQMVKAWECLSDYKNDRIPEFNKAPRLPN